MRRLLALIILVLLGFYVVWPLWSGYQIATAVQARDPMALAGKVDFEAVRESMRPTVTLEVDKRLDAQMAQLGGAGAMLGADIKKQLMPRVVDATLQMLVTPENVIRIASGSGDATATIRKVILEQVSKGLGNVADRLPGLRGGTESGAGGNAGNVLGNVLGGVMGSGGVPGLPGLGGGTRADSPQPQPAPPTPTATRSATSEAVSFGLGNIKGFTMDGPLGFALSLARDAGQVKPDVTAGMAFTGGDWKLVKLVPHL